MHIVYHILVFIAYFGILIDCYGVGSKITCKTDECRRKLGIVAGSIIGGSLVIMFGFIGIVCCRVWCNGRPFRKNSVFINITNSKQRQQEIDNVKPFQSGIWSSQYFHYKRCHGSQKILLLFDPQSMKVTGSGLDDVGSFTIDGIYSNQTCRIGLTKQYQSDIGDLTENLGHQVIIQLTWNVKNDQFEGKWYGKTKKYRGEDKFELKFDGQDPSNISEKV